MARNVADLRRRGGRRHEAEIAGAIDDDRSGRMGRIAGSHGAS